VTLHAHLHLCISRMLANNYNLSPLKNPPFKFELRQHKLVQKMVTAKVEICTEEHPRLSDSRLPTTIHPCYPPFV
jgi:hypothetical protein